MRYGKGDDLAEVGGQTNNSTGRFRSDFSGGGLSEDPGRVDTVIWGGGRDGPKDV